MVRWAVPGATAVLLAPVLVEGSLASGALVVCGAAVIIALWVGPARWIPVGAVLVLTVAAVLVPLPAVGILSVGPLRDVAVLAVGAVILAVTVVIRIRVPLPTPPVVFSGFLLLMVVVAASVANGADLWTVAPQWVMAVVAFVLGLTVGPAERRLLIGGWVVIGVALAAYSLYEQWMRPESLFAGLMPPGYRRSVTMLSGAEQFRSQATFGHPVPLSSWLAATFALVVADESRERELASRIVRFAVLAVVALGTAYTFARTGWISLAVALAATLLFRCSKAKGLARISMVALAAVGAVLISPVGERVVGYLQVTGETTGFQTRVANLRSVPGVVSSSGTDLIVGYGAGAGKELVGAPQSPDAPAAVDNQYVTLLLEAGIVGLAAFAGVVAVALKHGIRQARDEGPAAEAVVPLVVAAASLLAAMFFFELLYWPPTAVLFWCIVGMLCRPLVAGADRPAEPDADGGGAVGLREGARPPASVLSPLWEAP